MVAAIFERINTGTVTTFGQHFHRAVGKLQQLQDRRGRTDWVQIVRTRVIRRGIFLGNQHNFIVALIHHFERAY